MICKPCRRPTNQTQRDVNCSRSTTTSGGVSSSNAKNGHCHVLSPCLIEAPATVCMSGAYRLIHRDHSHRERMESIQLVLNLRRLRYSA